MILLFGITQGRKDLDFVQTVICRMCGRYGRYQVFYTYSAFTLFFIPLFKWGREYYVTSSCCGATYRLNPETGKRIERGELSEIPERDLQPVGGYGRTSCRKHCNVCGYETEEDFEFCPKCGNRF